MYTRVFGSLFIPWVPGTGTVTYVMASFTDIRYCRQVIDETLRCAVLAPWGNRVNLDHDLPIGGYNIPKEV